VQDGSPDALLCGGGVYRRLMDAEMSRLANRRTQAA